MSSKLLKVFLLLANWFIDLEKESLNLFCDFNKGISFKVP
jgi:hypothetical protein